MLYSLPMLCVFMTSNQCRHISNLFKLQLQNQNIPSQDKYTAQPDIFSPTKTLSSNLDTGLDVWNLVMSTGLDAGDILILHSCQMSFLCVFSSANGKNLASSSAYYVIIIKVPLNLQFVKQVMKNIIPLNPYPANKYVFLICFLFILNIGTISYPS